ncbi:hypothetical protein A9Q99_24015 [Gammaproteobacteria bacterium 45_16_T64]|nr:hypothetical protein A9Q99_24015 [Gammaproteobacteria bacterium 45_16_T64]
MFNHTVYSDIIEINAPKEAVWEILVDIDNYGAWNPFTYKVDGKLQVKQPIDLHVHMKKRGDRVQTETVEIIDAPNTLAWGMTFGLAPIMSALRKQELQSVSANRCTYSTSDAFSGLLSPLVYILFYDDVRDGFNQVALALKRRAEFLWNQQEITTLKDSVGISMDINNKEKATIS